MWAKVDDRGRVYLPKQVRDRVGREVFVIEVKDGVLLIPKPSDPFKELEELGKKLPDRPVRELRREIEDLAMEEVE
ncbi:AbrB/MazE/SpoVT family DNA-binding domain-containing protein [Geoglobus sp.]